MPGIGRGGRWAGREAVLLRGCRWSSRPRLASTSAADSRRASPQSKPASSGSGFARCGRGRRRAVRKPASGSPPGCVSTTRPDRPANPPGQPCAAGHRSDRGPPPPRSQRRHGQARSRPSIRRSPHRPPPHARPAPPPHRNICLPVVETLSNQPGHPRPGEGPTPRRGGLRAAGRRLGSHAAAPGQHGQSSPQWTPSRGHRSAAGRWRARRRR